jgi:hypothetical protein
MSRIFDCAAQDLDVDHGSARSRLAIGTEKYRSGSGAAAAQTVKSRKV